MLLVLPSGVGVCRGTTRPPRSASVYQRRLAAWTTIVQIHAHSGSAGQRGLDDALRRLAQPAEVRRAAEVQRARDLLVPRPGRQVAALKDLTQSPVALAVA